MKKLTLISSGLFVIGIASGGCAQAMNLSSRAPSQTRQTPELENEIQSFQNSAGCLDVSKMMQKVLDARLTRVTIVDVTFDGKPSDLLLANVDNGLNDPDSLADLTGSLSGSHETGLKQTGCSLLQLDDSAGSGTTINEKITASSADAVSVQGNLSINTDQNVHIGPIHRAFVYRALSAGQVEVQTETTASVYHDCGGNWVEEQMPETVTVVIDFGDTLPAAPRPSAALSALRERATAASAKFAQSPQSLDSPQTCAGLKTDPAL